MKQSRAGLKRVVAGILISTGVFAGGIVAVAGHHPATVAQSWHGAGPR